MGLKGDLKSISLANVLQDLAQNEQNGTLALTASDRRIHFWFEKGQLRLVGLGPGRGPSLLNGLLATGKLKLSELGGSARLDAEAALTRSLLKRNSIAKEDSRAALQQQMFELVCDAFLWTDASFEFTQGEPADELFDVDQLDHEVRLTCDPIIMEALRRIDEWPEIKRTVPTANEVLVTEAIKPAKELDPITARILGCLDGQRRLRDVIELVHLGAFNVFKAAATLKAAGLARALTGKEALDRARLFTAKSQWEPALRMARFALELEPASVVLRAIAAEALEKLERRDEAAAEYRLLAAAQAESGDKAAAITTCRRILTLAPRDTFTQERLFQLLLEAGHKENALSQGEALAAAYKRAGLPDKAIEVYTRLMSSIGDSDDLLEAIAEIARHLGDKKEAIQVYRKLFERALARNDEEAALQLSRTLLRLDPRLEDIAQRRVELETGVYRKRVALRRRLKALIVLFVVLVLGSALGIYEWRARDEHSAIRGDSIPLQAKGEYRKILERYDALLARWPWAITCRSARNERAMYEDYHADAQLGAAVALEAEGRLIEALAAAESVRDCSLTPKNRDRAEQQLVLLRKKRNDEENRWLEKALGWAREAKTNPDAARQIESIDDPLALPALGECLKSETTAVRLASVAALKKVPHDAALELLVRVLATDSLAAVRTEAQAALAERTGQNFVTALQWDEWLRKRASAQSPSRVPPLQATLVVESAAGPVIVRWELRNIGSTPIEFTLPANFGPAFEGLGPKGRAAVLKTPERPVRLEKDEFIGGRVEITGLEPGSYSVSWSGTIVWIGAAPASIRSLPLVIEIR